MEEFLEDIHQMRFITNEKHVQLLQQIVDEIKAQNLTNDAIVTLFAKVDAEIVDDILKMLEDDKFLTKEDNLKIDNALIKIYDEEFLKDLRSGELKTRLSLKTNKNARPISRFEILGIFFSRTLNAKLLWERETTDDEILKALVQTHKELCVVRKSNAIYEKQQKNMEEVLMSVLEKLDETKTQIIN